MFPRKILSLSSEYAVSLYPKAAAPLTVRVFAEDRYHAIETAWRRIGFVDLDSADARLI